MLKDPGIRDALRDQYGVRAIEMEGFGIAEASWLSSAGFFVVRGICDYCDSGKNDDWQEYAAIVAAAYTRALLEEIGPVTPRLDREETRKRFFAEDADASIRPTITTPPEPRATTPIQFDSPIEAEHQAQLDRIRELIASKDQSALALDELEALRARAWAGASRPVRARVLGLRGYAKIELGKGTSTARCNRARSSWRIAGQRHPWRRTGSGPSANPRSHRTSDRMQRSEVQIGCAGVQPALDTFGNPADRRRSPSMTHSESSHAEAVRLIDEGDADGARALLVDLLDDG